LHDFSPVLTAFSGFQEKYDFHPDAIFRHLILFNGYSLFQHSQSCDIPQSAIGSLETHFDCVIEARFGCPDDLCDSRYTIHKISSMTWHFPAGSFNKSIPVLDSFAMVLYDDSPLWRS